MNRDSNGRYVKGHIEHKIPLSRGGLHAIENLDISCQSCNCSKNTKTVEEFREWQAQIG